MATDILQSMGQTTETALATRLQPKATHDV
jgi:hypothetical protein